MELSGEWRAVVADDALRRRAPEPDLDDGSWYPIPVPGHWRSVPAFADSDGPVLYRRRFEPSARPQRASRGTDSNEHLESPVVSDVVITY